MAENLVENQVCQTCGADVRPNTLFCYNCGGSIKPGIAVALKDKKDVGEAVFRDKSAEKDNQTAKIEQPISGQIANKPILKPGAIEETKLKSAAAMRRKSKIYQPKRVEIVWEERAPNGWFILAAILLTLFAAGIFYLAIYLK